MNSITDIQKIYELSKIWKEAAYNFAFWDKVDIDWDGEYKKALARVLETENLYDYYRELMRFATLLNDGHTGVSFPGGIYQDAEYFSMIPVYLFMLGDKIIVFATSEDLKDRIPLYSVLEKIDGADVHDYIRENCYPYFWHANEAACGLSVVNELMFGKRGSGAVFTFEKDGRQFDVRLEREEPSKIAWCRTDITPANSASQRMISSSDIHQVFFADDETAVIRMTSFADNSLPEKIYSCFEELKKAKGYILDVRGNSGGNSGNADAIAALFIDGEFRSCYAETQVYEPTLKARSILRDDFRELSPDEALAKYTDDENSMKTYRMGRNIFYVNDGGNAVAGNAPGKLNGPVIVLMNEYTISAAEDFIDVMKMYTDAVFIGNNTAGSSGQPLCETLESGGSFRICTRRCIAQNGEDIYNRGFAPDIKIIPEAEDIAAGRDAVLEKGLEIMKKMNVQ